MPLTWDFARQLDAAASPGNTTSYYDEACQSFYLDSGTIRTRIAQLEDGQWQNIEPEDEIVISESGFSSLDIEHHYNGLVAGSAQHDTSVVLLIYDYMLDVSPWLADGYWQLQPDNAIKAGSITLLNADDARFADDAFTIFAPGNRLVMSSIVGDSDPYQIGIMHIERSPYSEMTESFSFSGRNALGFYLSNQTFDERTSYSGTRSAVFAAILADAGVPSRMIRIKTDITLLTLSFDSSKAMFAGITEAAERINWYVDDLPDGTIVIGDEDYIKSQVATTGIYTFTRGSDVVSRSVTRDSSGVYSRVCVRRKGATPLSLYADVPYFDGWALTGNRTFYQDVPDDTSQADMEAVRDNLVAELQYSGITESFTGLFRPWLQLGDVGVIGGTDSRLVGIISDIKLRFGRSGYFTDFSVTSGGTISNPDNPATVATKYRGKMGGANRKRRLLDLLLAKDTTMSSGSTTKTTEATGITCSDSSVVDGDLVQFDGVTGKVIRSSGKSISDFALAEASLPAGGVKGQILVKASETDFDVIWEAENIWGGM